MSGHDRGAALSEAPGNSSADSGNGTAVKFAKRGGKVAGSRIQQVYDIKVFCVGQSPLLTSQYKEEDIIADLVRGERRPKPKDVPLETLASNTIYRDDESRIVLPRDMIFACLCNGGSHVTLKGRSKLSNAGGANSKVPNFLKILGGKHIPLLRPDGTPLTDEDWEKSVMKVPQSNSGGRGGATAAVRALFPEWAFLVTVRIDLSKAEGLSLGTVRQLFDAAGDAAGVGSHRTRGGYGRFTVADGGWVVTEVDQSTLLRPKAPADIMAIAQGATIVQQS